MSNSSHYRAFRALFDSLITGVSSTVDEVAAKAFARELITKQHLSDATNKRQGEADRANHLLQNILARVELNPKTHFDTFVSILKDVPTLEELAGQLVAELNSQECLIEDISPSSSVGASPSQPLVKDQQNIISDVAVSAVADPEERSTAGAAPLLDKSSSESTGKSAQEESDTPYFQCRCGNNCSFNDYLSGKYCGSLEISFPRLNIKHLSNGDKDKLIRKLIFEADSMREKFDDLVCNTFEVLDQQNTKVDKLVAVVSTVGRQQSHPIAISEKHDELRACKTVYEVQTFLVNQKYISFFNYRILEKIVLRFAKDNPTLKKEMESYLTDFAKFCKRSIFEVPAIVIANFTPACDPHWSLVIKVYEKVWFGAVSKPPDSSFTFEDLMMVEVKLAAIIGIDPTNMLLRDVKDGCVELSFVILSDIVSSFPLSSLQNEQLTSLGIDVIQHPTVPTMTRKTHPGETMKACIQRPIQQSGTVRASYDDFNVHSSCYNDFFLLRTPITINGRPAVIKVVNGEPMMRINSISVKLSTILQQAVAPVARKHGVYQVDNFYYEQVALFSMKFQSKSSLKQFLTDKETVQEELSLAIANLFKEAARSSKQSQSMEQIHVTVNTKLYFVSPGGIGHSPDVHEINRANHSFMVDRWKRSKLFGFTSALFTKPPPSKYSDQALASQANGGDHGVTTISSKSVTQKTNQFDSTNDTPTKKRGVIVENAKLADLQMELKEVITWFDLGVQLKIPTHDLLAIREDHRTVEKCRLEMLVKWEQLEKPTWTKLFSALVNIGMKGLADRIAEKYGLPQPFRVAVTPAKDSASYKLMESEQQLSVKRKELTRAKQSQALASEKFEKELSEEVPLLQHEVKTLTEETEFLQMQLEQRNQELELFKKMKQTAKQDELKLLDHLLKEKNEQIKSLEDELIQKKNELDSTKKQLRDKETELAKMMGVLSVKSAQVSELETEVEKLRQSFNEQQEEMNKKLIEESAKSVSHEKYLKEVEIQRDIAMKEASKTKKEIQSYSQELTDKEKQISQLSEKIAEQEKEMAKLQEELASHHRTSEQLSAEQTREDDKKEQQLLTLMMSAMKLQLELQETKAKKNQDKMNLEGTKKTMEKLLLLGDMEGQSSATTLVKEKEETTTVDLSGIKLSWRAAESAPLMMKRSVDAAVGGDIMHIRPRDTPLVLAYNSTNDTWYELPDTPTKCCSITVINGVLTTVGGELNWQPTNKLFSLVEESDGRKKWVETLPPMPEKETHTRTVCCGTHLIVASRLSSTIQLMDTTSHKWSLVANQPLQSDLLYSLVVCEEYLYLVYNNKIVFRCLTSDLVQSTPQKTGIWSEIEHTGFLYCSTYVAIHDHLISVGGRDGLNPTTDVRMYSPSTKTWEVIGHMKTPRWYCFAAVLPNNRLLVVGGNTTSSALSETSEAEIATIVWPQ